MKRLIIVTFLIHTFVYARLEYTNYSTTIDHTTKLEWANSSQPKVWKNAIEYCNNSNAGAKQDWRLPDINELNSLFDYKNEYKYKLHQPSNHPYFWSSTTYVGVKHRAFFINVSDSTISKIDKANTLRVICVRSLEIEN